MSSYTDMLLTDAETLSPDDDDFEERLLEIAGRFHGFGEALTDFLLQHGYEEDPKDSEKKIQFLKQQFKSAKIAEPRSIAKWFQPDMRIKRSTAFLLCFAFHLSVEETEEFFRCVQLERGFDCHTVSEAVYYFCMKTGRTCQDAQRILKRIPEPSKRAKTLPKGDVLYTGTILESLNRIGDEDTLIQFLTETIEDFRYNNATALKFIRDLWTQIAKPDGLAVREGVLIDKAYNRFNNRDRKENADDYSVVSPPSNPVETKPLPTWPVFSQIIGLSNGTEQSYASRHDRSLTVVLSENALLPLRASYCFPGRQSIDKLVRGELSDNEQIRKMLIFLTFYAYWAKVSIEEKTALFTAKRSDCERCKAVLDGRLLDAGYPVLYAGNPYDWIFLWSLNDDHPLEAFRCYMGEVFAVKESAQ